MHHHPTTNKSEFAIHEAECTKGDKIIKRRADHNTSLVVIEQCNSFSSSGLVQAALDNRA